MGIRLWGLLEHTLATPNCIAANISNCIIHEPTTLFAGDNLEKERKAFHGQAEVHCQHSRCLDYLATVPNKTREY
jgi:hypothetical protein